MSHTDKLRRWAKVLKMVSLAAMLVLAAALAYGLFFGRVPQELLDLAGITDPDVISNTRRAAIAAVGILPALGMFYVLSQMAALFARYSEGELLSEACANHILRIGVALLAIIALDVVAGALQGVIASAVNAPGSRVLAITFQGMDLGQFLAGGLLLTIGWTLREAARIAEENRAFV
ncbi:MAG: DUF2975 domain-containing protein [Pseudomonadota bacterium]